MQVNAVSLNSRVQNPHAGKVEAVDGMDDPVRARAGRSKEVAKRSEFAAQESQCNVCARTAT